MSFETQNIQHILARLELINNTMLQLYNPETGEVDEAHSETYAALCEDIEQLFSVADDAMGAYVDFAEELQGDIANWEKRAQQCLSALKIRRNHLSVMRDNIMRYVKQKGGKYKVKGIDGCAYALYARSYDSVNCFDIEKIPMYFTRVELIPDKKLIKTAIQNGKIVPGAELVKKHTIIIR